MTIGVEDAYDLAAEGYDTRHGDARSVRRFARIDRPQLAAAAGAHAVLEVGCGTGRLLSRTAAPVRVGIDVSTGMLARARRRGLAVLRADAHALPFADGSFDAVLAGKGVFRYLAYDRAFAECARVLRAGGRLVVHQYARATWSLRRGGPVVATHVGDLDELTAPARAAGLRCAQVHLWRSVRVWPYLVRIPAWAPGTLWSHCTLVFHK